MIHRKNGNDGKIEDSSYKASRTSKPSEPTSINIAGLVRDFFDRQPKPVIPAVSPKPIKPSRFFAKKEPFIGEFYSPLETVTLLPQLKKLFQEDRTHVVSIFSRGRYLAWDSHPQRIRYLKFMILHEKPVNGWWIEGRVLNNRAVISDYESPDFIMDSLAQIADFSSAIKLKRCKTIGQFRKLVDESNTFLSDIFCDRSYLSMEVDPKNQNRRIFKMHADKPNTNDWIKAQIQDSIVLVESLRGIKAREIVASAVKSERAKTLEKIEPKRYSPRRKAPSPVKAVTNLATRILR